MHAFCVLLLVPSFSLCFCAVPGSAALSTVNINEGSSSRPSLTITDSSPPYTIVVDYGDSTGTKEYHVNTDGAMSLPIQPTDYNAMPKVECDNNFEGGGW